MAVQHADPTDQQTTSSISPPTPLSVRLVRYIVGFGVGVGIGLAPYLGKLQVPGFDALLSLIPDSVQGTALPLSALLMGAVAVWVQWTAGDQPSRAWLRRAFRRGLLVGFISLVAFIVVQTLVVVELRIPAENRSVSFLVGFTRSNRPPCTSEKSDAECIKLITVDEARIAAQWGDTQIRLARLALVTSYLATTATFGLLVGIFLTRESIEAVGKTPPRRKGPPRVPRPRRSSPVSNAERTDDK